MASQKSGGRRYLPYVFCKHGVAMLSSVLNTKRTVQVNIAVIRTFVRLRQVLATNRDLAIQLAALERRFAGHDEAIQKCFDAIRTMLAATSSAHRCGLRGLAAE